MTYKEVKQYTDTDKRYTVRYLVKNIPFIAENVKIKSIDMLEVELLSDTLDVMVTYSNITSIKEQSDENSTRIAVASCNRSIEKMIEALNLLAISVKDASTALDKIKQLIKEGYKK